MAESTTGVMSTGFQNLVNTENAVRASLQQVTADNSAQTPPVQNQQEQQQQQQPVATAQELGLTEPIRKETVITPEEQQRIRTSEGHQVVHANIARAGREVEEAYKKNKNQQFTETQRSAYTYYDIYRQLTNPSGKLEGPIDLRDKGGNPLRVSKRGESYYAAGGQGQPVDSITEIVVRDGTRYCKCMVRSANGSSREVEISVSEILNGQLLSQEQSLKETFTPDSAQSTVLNSYTDYLKNRQNGAEFKVENATLEEAALQTGLLRAESLRSLIVESTKGQAERGNQLLSLLDGQLIADPQTAGVILHELNGVPAQVAQFDTLITQNNTEIENLRSKIAGITDETQGAQQLKHQMEAQIAELQGENASYTKQVEDLKALAEALPKNGRDGLIALVSSLYDGSISVDQAQRVNKALESKNMNSLLEELIGGLKEKNPDQAKEYEKYLQAAKLGGVGIVAILALMVMRSLNEQ